MKQINNHQINEISNLLDNIKLVFFDINGTTINIHAETHQVEIEITGRRTFLNFESNNFSEIMAVLKTFQDVHTNREIRRNN